MKQPEAPMVLKVQCSQKSLTMFSILFFIPFVIIPSVQFPFDS